MAFRVKRDPSAAREGPGEFSPARHLGERGDAAWGNQSGPRVHAGTAVRWAAGADLAAPSAVRAVPRPRAYKGVGIARFGSVRFSEWGRMQPGERKNSGSPSVLRSAAPGGDAFGARGGRQRALARALGFVRVRNGICSNPLRDARARAQLFLLLFKMDRTPQCCLSWG